MFQHRNNTLGFATTTNISAGLVRSSVTGCLGSVHRCFLLIDDLKKVKTSPVPEGAQQSMLVSSLLMCISAFLALI